MTDDNSGMKKMDQIKIDEITRQFFDLFTNTNNRIPNIRIIEKLFLPQGLLINNTLDVPAIYDLESFIKPREEILSNGTLTNFIETETSHITEICGKIAHRICDYKKSGKLNGEAFKGEGKKIMQFIKLKNEWILSSVIWNDKNECQSSK